MSNYAIFLSGSGTGVTLKQVTALAEDASNLNAGLINFSRATAVLYGGNYTAREGTNAYGIFNIITATLEANNVTAPGENGTNLNTGLYNYNNSTALLYGGDYTGRGGNQTGGAGASLNSTLTAYGVTALVENGSGTNDGLLNSTGTMTADSSQFTGSSYGVYLIGGTVYLGVSQLDGSATIDGGTLTCYGVYDETYTAYTCP